MGFIEDAVKQGDDISAITYDVTKVRVHDLTEETGSAEVTCLVRPYKQYLKDGTLKESSPGGRIHLDFSMVQRKGSWYIVNSIDLRS